ncbi:MAG: UDP-N-acetylmuramoyl-L-alanine--D-glutamate ligase [Actinomycetota bacterium]
MTSGPAATTPDLGAPVVVGFGVTSRAVVRALVARGHHPIVLEDRPGDEHRAVAAELGVDLIERPDADDLAKALAGATVLLPSPGIPDHHPVFAAARTVGVPLASEFDLAQAWDDRPVVAITGTNGKTTVTMMVADALVRSGRPAVAVGNTDIPFVEAIDPADPEAAATEVFVVEASSFRLAHSARFRPQVAGWLNFAPDHLDAHATLADYEAAKASIWAHQPPGSTAVVNADDPVVTASVESADLEARGVRVVRFSIEPGGNADWSVADVDGRPNLVGPDGPLLAVDELARRQPHDVANALATAALALAAGATVDGVADALRHFVGLPHRLQPVGSWSGIAWFNDSKATVPHATVAAVGGFDSVVLIAGGHPKGLSFEPLRETAPPVRTVVAIGEAAPEIEAVFDGLAPVEVASSMDEAIEAADRLARPGDAVVLSPACASFDWYRNYVDRGDDFTRRVRARFQGSATEGTTP